jgi:hypothetical protein
MGSPRTPEVANMPAVGGDGLKTVATIAEALLRGLSPVCLRPVA